MSAEKTRLRSGASLAVIEMGQDWLKIAHTHPSRGGVTVSALHLEPVDPGPGCSPAAVASAWKRLKLGGSLVVACLPRQAANIRILDLPSTDPAEIADMVELQVGKHTPHSRDEVVLDYRILGPGRAGYTQVMLAIVQRGLVRQRYHVMEEAGLDVHCMTISSEGLIPWCAQAGLGSGTCALLDMDSYYTDLAVVSDGKMVFSRSLLMGANQLLGEYARWKEKFALEVQRSLEGCRAEQAGLRIDKLYVSGAGANVPALASDLQAQLGVAVETKSSVLPGVKMPASPSLKDPKFQAVSITALLGIGMMPETLEFHLVPDSVRLRKGLLSKAKLLSAFGVLVMTALLGASLFATLRLSFRWSRRNELRQRVEAAAPGVQRVERMQEVVKAVQERRNLRITPVAMLAEIHRTTPDDVLIDSIDLDAGENRMLVEGSTAARPSIRALIQGLEQSSLFQGVKEEGASSQDSQSGRYRFRIVFALEGRP